MEAFSVSILNNDQEDILWIKLTSKMNRTVSYPICVCYLLPEGSSNYVDANEFFDVLLMQVYTYQEIGSFFICGGMNSRMGDMDDFIEGVDNIVDRHIIDSKRNNYGKLLQQFLFSTETCILNGRNSLSNDYTSVSEKGLAVVDYVIVPSENLTDFTNTEVVRAREVFDKVHSDLHSSLPDHSLIKWDMRVEVECDISKEARNFPPTTKTVYNFQSIPNNFMLEENVVREVQDLINKLESEQTSQKVVTDMFSDICVVVNNEMDNNLEARKISSLPGCKAHHKPE